MQAIFTDIVNRDEESVLARIEEDPNLVNAVATGSPKKYVGQSVLQVAIRMGEFGIARLLLDKGSDPAFVDVKSPTGWSRSVIHDAAVGAVMRSRWSRRPADEKHERSYEFPVALIEAGADATAEDSKGSTPLAHAVRAAHDVLPRRNDEKPELSDGKPFTPELLADLTRVFDLLKAHGADPDRVEPQLGKSPAYHYRHELVGKILAGTAVADAS